MCMYVYICKHTHIYIKFPHQSYPCALSLWCFLLSEIVLFLWKRTFTSGWRANLYKEIFRGGGRPQHFKNKQTSFPPNIHQPTKKPPQHCLIVNELKWSKKFSNALSDKQATWDHKSILLVGLVTYIHRCFFPLIEWKSVWATLSFLSLHWPRPFSLLS